MKVLIAVGGGGHFSPALAVIEKMPKDWDILLVGRKYAFEGDSALAFEYQTAQRLGLPFETLTTGRLQRKFTRHSVTSLVKMPVGLVQAKKIISRYKPDVILSFGGYISTPVVLAAAALRLPIVIHEQTLHAGLANVVASKFASKICISWEESEAYFPQKKTVLTGNPLRKEFLNLMENGKEKKERAKKKTLPVIYITGGSGGAHGVNVLIEGCLTQLLEKYTIIHQTGDAKEFGDFDHLEKIKMELPKELQKRYILKKFLPAQEVISSLKQAQLVVSRSGINTVTELLYLGKPCLLIPLPYGQHNEQLTNAKFVRKLGLAEVVDQLSITAGELEQNIASMIEDIRSYEVYKAKAQQLIHTDAAENIIKEVNRFAHE